MGDPAHGLLQVPHQGERVMPSCGKCHKVLNGKVKMIVDHDKWLCEKCYMAGVRMMAEIDHQKEYGDQLLSERDIARMEARQWRRNVVVGFWLAISLGALALVLIKLAWWGMP